MDIRPRLQSSRPGVQAVVARRQPHRIWRSASIGVTTFDLMPGAESGGDLVAKTQEVVKKGLDLSKPLN